MITKNLMKNIQSDLDKVLKELSEKHGVSIATGGGTFNELSGKLKVVITAKEENGKKVNIEAEEFKAQAVFFGLKPEDLGREFEFSGRTLKVAGLKTKNSKYPIIVEDAEGKSYKLTAGSVAAKLHGV